MLPMTIIPGFWILVRFPVIRSAVCLSVSPTSGRRFFPPRAQRCKSAAHKARFLFVFMIKLLSVARSANIGYAVKFRCVMIAQSSLQKSRCRLDKPMPVFCSTICATYMYVKHNMKNLYGTGELVAYVGLFGKGKTLSAVHKVVSAYNKYDGLTVWCPRRRKLVTQRIKIISNVALSVPYEEFVSLEQIVLDAEKKVEYDDANDTLTFFF